MSWQVGTVIEVITETSRANSIVLELVEWPGHCPGQHVDVRLAARDGSWAQRSYSIASAPEDGYVVLTVERLDEGKVSPYLVDELASGDGLEMRGPLGGDFAWEPENRNPVLLLAEGPGIVPFRSMLRHCIATRSTVPVRVLYSSRSLAAVIYYDELLRLAAYNEVDIRFVLTREWPKDWQGHHTRVDRELLREVSWAPDDRPLVYVSGSNEFVETTAREMVLNGHQPSRVKKQCFGSPSS